ncbi:hypothetical protein MKZ38_004162 [Zalerion maritima]|uniref:FAD-binding domain-containing protein n=1 Tax=Zalerion maritima TaxID=339359 RepID=A0AAD5WR92_9PEZI|nr:hypothetical protein MKZ38_004162 [Zalerion maritima]
MSGQPNSPVPTIETDVVIVGGGPAGASLACFLASHGIKGIIIEQHSTSADTPRAHITNMAAQECLRDVGLDAVLENLSTKGDCMKHTRWCASMAGREFARIYSWGNDPSRVGDYERASPCRPVDLPQTLLEPELVRHAALHGFQMRWDTEYVSFAESPSGVAVAVRDKLTKAEYVARGKYLFGADGARSPLAAQLSLPFSRGPGGGLAFNVLVKADLSHLIKTRMGNLHWIMQPLHDNPPDFAAMSIVRMVKPWHEWMFIFFPAPGYVMEKENPITTEMYLERVREMIGDDTPAEILKVNPWTINETVADVYSKGRVFCLGDAVHRHPPFNGLGSNTCIQDAFNLAWKVAYVLKGKAGPDLLDTYSVERAPVGKSIVQRANDGFRDHSHVWDALGIFLPSLSERQSVIAELEASSPAGRERRAKLQAAVEQTAHEFHGLGVEMNQCYVSSAIASQDSDGMKDGENVVNGTVAPKSNDGNSGEGDADPILTHVPSTIPGRRLPHVWLNAGPIPSSELVSTIDLAGRGAFSLFTGLGGSAAWKAAAKHVGDALGLPIRAYSIGFGEDFEDCYFDWSRVCGIEDSGCILARPDRFVAWRVNDIPSTGDAEKWASDQLQKTMRGILSRKA